MELEEALKRIFREFNIVALDITPHDNEKIAFPCDRVVSHKFIARKVKSLL